MTAEEYFVFGNRKETLDDKLSPSLEVIKEMCYILYSASCSNRF